MRRNRLSLSCFLACVLAGAAASAQDQGNHWSGWGYADAWAYGAPNPAASSSFGAEGGVSYGNHVTVGLAASIFHPWRFTSITPEVEFYLGMTAEISHYNLWVYAGAGIYTDPDPTWTGRLSLWWYDSRPLGLYTSLFAMWTPTQGNVSTASVLIQPRPGLEIKIADHWQAMTYLQLAVTVPNGDVSVGPGIMFLWGS